MRLAAFPAAFHLLHKLGLINQSQLEFIEFARTHHIESADAASALPLEDCSVDALYSSHMLEHLDQPQAVRFLGEARRVLRAGGVIRLAVPDLRRQLDHYREVGDADAFVTATQLAYSTPPSVAERLRFLFVGARHHRWMYDGKSLCNLLLACGFSNPFVLPSGETRILNPGALDLAERASESVYVEAVRN